MRDLPKNVKRQLRDLIGWIYERELELALNGLSCDFEDWKLKKIDAFELEKRVHRFHQGPARTLFNRYSGNPNLELLVAGAVEERIIDKEDIPEELLPYLENAFALFEEARATRSETPAET